MDNHRCDQPTVITDQVAPDAELDDTADQVVPQAPTRTLPAWMLNAHPH